MAWSEFDRGQRRGRLVRIQGIELVSGLTGTTPISTAFSLPIGTYAGCVVFENTGSINGLVVTVRIQFGVATLGDGGTDLDVFNTAYSGGTNGAGFSFPASPLFGGIVAPTSLNGAEFCVPGPATDWNLVVVADGASVSTINVSITALSHVLEV